jgi:hypothetical protein
MVFATNFRSLSKCFFLLLSISALRIGAAEQVLVITPQEPGAPMPTRFGCLKGWEEKLGDKTTKYVGFIADVGNFNGLYHETSNDANEKKGTFLKSMNKEILYMKVPIIHKRSLEKNEARDQNWLNTLMLEMRNQREKPKDYDSPVLDLLWEFGTALNNKNCAVLFFTLGGYVPLSEASKQLSLCSPVLENSTTVVGNDPEKELPVHTKKLQTHIAATRLVATAMKEFLNETEKWCVDFTADSAPFIDLNNELLIKSLKKTSGSDCADQEIRTIILSAYTTQLEKQVAALKESELQKQKTELENKIKQQADELNQVKIKNARLTEANKKAEEDCDGLGRKCTGLTDESNGLRQQLQAKQASLTTAEANLKNVTEEKTKLETAFQESTTNLAAMKAQLTTATNEKQKEIDELAQQLKASKQTGTTRCTVSEPNKKDNPDQKPKSRFSFLFDRSFIAGGVAGSIFTNVTALCAYKFGWFSFLPPLLTSLLNFRPI